MHGKKLKSRQRMIVEQPLPPSLAQAFAEIDAADRARYRSRPLNVGAFDQLDPGTAKFTTMEPRRTHPDYRQGAS